MIYRFGDCEYDAEAGELRRAGSVVVLQPKPLALLAYLIEHRERIVSKDELLEALWPDAVVTDGSLMKAVSLARRALGKRDDDIAIRSIARRGYRFIGTVSEASADPNGSRAARSQNDFVGREDCLARLRGVWDHASVGSAQVVLVRGEAGMGKTRLLVEFERELRGRGERVVTGRSDPDAGAPAYWPWTQAFRRGTHALGAGAAAQELASAVESIGGPFGATAGGGPAHARYRLFDASVRAIGEITRERPLCIIIEDLHSADDASLLLLEHLTAELRTERIMIVGSLRTSAGEPSPILERVLAAVGRDDKTSMIDLDGLTLAHVKELVTAGVSREIPSDVIAELFERTSGNPLFVRKGLQLLMDGASSGELSLEELPAQASGIVGRQLDGLGEPCRRLLEAAAVVGPVFLLRTVAEVADLDPRDALERVDEAVRLGVLEADPRRGRLRFAHPLYREAVYATLPPNRSARLHLRAGKSLERARAGQPESVLSELAHHFHRALPLVEPRRALECARAAAKQAHRLAAWEQVALHHDQALDAFDELEGASSAERFELLIDAAEAHRLGGRRERRRELLEEAFALARRADLKGGAVRAATAFCDLGEWSPVDPLGRRLVEQVLEMQGSAPSEERARLLTRLAYLGRSDRAQLEPIAREGVEMARAYEDSSSLIDALYALHLMLAGPRDFDERERLVAEMVQRLTPTDRSPDLGVIALLDIASDRLARGDATGAAAARESAEALAGVAPHRALRWHLAVYDCGLSVMTGQLRSAEDEIREAFHLGRALGHPYAMTAYTGHLLGWLDAQGRLPELGKRLRTAGGDSGARDEWEGPYAVSLGAWLPAAAGQREIAQTALTRAVHDQLESWPLQTDWLCALTALSTAAAIVGDEAIAGILRERLSAYGHLHAVVPVAVCYAGPVAQSLGRLSATLGELQDARDHLEDALETSSALNAHPTVASIRADLGRVLVRLGKRRAGEDMLDASRGLAARLGISPPLPRTDN